MSKLDSKLARLEALHEQLQIAFAGGYEPSQGLIDEVRTLEKQLFHGELQGPRLESSKPWDSLSFKKGVNIIDVSPGGDYVYRLRFTGKPSLETKYKVTMRRVTPMGENEATRVLTKEEAADVVMTFLERLKEKGVKLNE